LTSPIKIQELKASLDALGGEIAQLDSEVAQSKKDLAAEEAESQKAVQARNAVHQEYLKKEANLTESVDAIKRAIASLKQSRAKVISVKSAAALLSIYQSSVQFQDALAAKASPNYGQPAVYKYKSQDVIAILEGLLATFKAELASCNEEEAVARHDFDMIEGARANKMTALKDDIDTKEKISAQKAEEVSEKQGILSDETAARSADEAFLADLTSGCEAKAASWDERSKTRAAEITALSEGIRTLEGMGDAYNVNSKLVGLLSVNKQSSATSFLQTHRQPRSTWIRKLKRFLRHKAKTLRSTSMLALAMQITLDDDHFVRVRSLIKDLISRLKAEALAEADQKSFCDKEMGSATQNRDKQASSMESISTTIDSTSTDITMLKKDIASLAEEIAGLNKALTEMTDLRQSEKAQNQKAVTDAEAGSAAVNQAITILTNFYGLLQTQKYVPPKADRQGQTVGDLAPDTFSGKYDGKVAESKGIIGLLQVIASDFDRTAATTKTTEEAQAAAFTKQSEEINGQISSKEATQTTKEASLKTKEAEVIDLKDNLRDATKLHSEALQTLESLKSSCVDAAESWEERKMHREKEIAALKQALQILEDWQG